MNPGVTQRTRATGPDIRARSGYTLIEAVLGTAVAVIILAGVVGVMFLAYSGLSSGADKADTMSRQSRAIQTITLDLSLATALSEQSATAVTVVVPDRNGDGQPETIRYAWSGTPGDPLTRQVNGVAPAVMAEDVHLFNLTYTAAPQALSTPPEVRQLAFRHADYKEACP
jgi:hypothetical protein